MEAFIRLGLSPNLLTWPSRSDSILVFFLTPVWYSFSHEHILFSLMVLVTTFCKLNRTQVWGICVLMGTMEQNICNWDHLRKWNTQSFPSVSLIWPDSPSPVNCLSCLNLEATQGVARTLHLESLALGMPARAYWASIPGPTLTYCGLWDFCSPVRQGSNTCFASSHRYEDEMKQCLWRYLWRGGEEPYIQI